MRVYTVEVDEEVYNYLVDNINDFGEPPNAVLRRLLGLERVKGNTRTASRDNHQQELPIKRRPKTRLSTLVRNNFLNKDDNLTLVIDGKEIIKAKIDGDSVLYNNKKYSMSALAVEFLRKAGYDTYAARGPAYWFKNDNSVMVLWDEYLRSKDIS